MPGVEAALRGVMKHNMFPPTFQPWSLKIKKTSSTTYVPAITIKDIFDITFEEIRHQGVIKKGITFGPLSEAF